MNRLRRLEDAFENGLARMLPASWDLGSRTPAASIIGSGIAAIVVGGVMLVTAMVSDYEAEAPAVYLFLGVLILSLGIVMNRRRHSRRAAESP